MVNRSVPRCTSVMSVNVLPFVSMWRAEWCEGLRNRNGSVRTSDVPSLLFLRLFGREWRVPQLCWHAVRRRRSDDFCSPPTEIDGLFSCRAERVRNMTDLFRCCGEAASTLAHFGTHKSLSAASSKCGVGSRDGDAEAPCWLIGQVIGERDARWPSVQKRRRHPESRWDIDRAYEDGWAEQSGRWRGLSGRGQRLRLDHSGCGWSRILWAGCILHSAVLRGVRRHSTECGHGVVLAQLL